MSSRTGPITQEEANALHRRVAEHVKPTLDRWSREASAELEATGNAKDSLICAILETGHLFGAVEQLRNSTNMPEALFWEIFDSARRSTVIVNEGALPNGAMLVNRTRGGEPA